MKSKNVRVATLSCAALGLALLATAAACGGGGGGGGGGDGGGNPPPPVVGNHSQIVLRDRYGAALVTGSHEPYSPRETCGPCHDVDAVASAYHFQQGRTRADATVQTADDFFRDGRAFLKSDGMYGKW